MKSTRVMAGIAAAGVVFTLAACSGGSGGGDGNVELTFLNTQQGNFDKTIEEFEASHPGVTIKQQTVPFDDLNSQIQARLGSKDPSVDLIAVDASRVAAMVKQGFIKPLSDEDAALAEKGVAPSTYDYLSVDGKLQVYPWDVSDGILMYNEQMLADLGVTPPGPEDRWTWEQIIDIGTQAQQKGLAEYAFTIYQIDRYYQLQPILMSQGAESGLEGDDNLTPAVNTPEWVEFGQWYSGIHEDGLAPRGVAPEQVTELFANGKTPFEIGTIDQASIVNQGSIGKGWGVSKFPYFEGKDVAVPTGAWNIGVSAYSKHADLAAEFARYVTLDADGAALSTTTVSTFAPSLIDAVPAWTENLTAQTSPEIAERVSAVLLDDIQYAVDRPKSSGYVQFETTINKAFSDIRNGLDPKQVLDGAQSELERQLSQ
jgi:ABC-type glycerol-3-phosphate transport system substrate-binding protein